MLWFLILVLAFVAVSALLMVLVVFALGSSVVDDEQARIDTQVRRAERQLHHIAREGFAAMLAEARSKAAP